MGDSARALGLVIVLLSASACGSSSPTPMPTWKHDFPVGTCVYLAGTSSDSYVGRAVCSELTYKVVLIVDGTTESSASDACPTGTDATYFDGTITGSFTYGVTYCLDKN